MHARELVELAGIAATHGAALVYSQPEIPRAGIDRYWTASKCRLDRWARTLKGLAAGLPGPPLPWPPGPWSYLVSVLEEILTGDVLARTWAAVTKAHAMHHGDHDAETLARSVYIGQLEARLRALKIVLHGPGIDAEQARVLNWLRRQSERWTDVLLARFMKLADVAEFSFEERRTRDFARDMAEDEGRPGGERAWPILMASLAATFQQAAPTTKPNADLNVHAAAPTSPNADLNFDIASGVLGCFSPHVFDGVGRLHSARTAALTRVVDETQCLLDDLFADAGGRDETRSSAPASPHRGRFGVDND